jgi:ankyrin repeat protein
MEQSKESLTTEMPDREASNEGEQCLKDVLKMTALHFAVACGDAAAAQRLIASGADPSARDVRQRTPLDYAIAIGWDRLVPLLRAAASPSQPQAIKAVTEKSEGPELRERPAPFKDAFARPVNPLLAAVRAGNYASARSAIAGGAQVDARDGRSATALHLAVEQGHLAIARLLLDAGADANALTRERNTPLHLAVMKDRADFVQLLLAYGAHPAIKSLLEKSPLDLATEARQRELVMLFEIALTRGMVRRSPSRPSDGVKAGCSEAPRRQEPLFPTVRENA